MKKIISLILALVMVMGLAVSASAASITINPNVTGGTDAGETYNAYKVFDATISGENVAYTIVGEGENKSQFYDTIAAYTYNEVKIFALAEINDTGVYNVQVDASFTGEDAAKDLAAALKAVATTVTATSTNGKFENLTTGYYLITDTLGSALIVDTLGDVEISTKNAYPSLTKKIVDGDKEVTTITADRGETITFKITVNIPATVNGDITVHDTLDEDMTFAELTTTTGVSKVDCTDGNVCFLIDYDAVNKDENGDVSFTYTATLNADAETATAHTNVAKLTYSQFTSTETDAVSVYTYEVDVYKWTGSEETGLAGAGFVLSKGDMYYKLDAGKVEWVESIDDATEYVTAAETYTVTFAGLANGTYTLIEKTVPAGYNKANDTEFTIENANMKGESQISVENKTGSELPSTGGIGTTLFYVIGGLLMTGAVVLMVTKKRMA